MNSKLKFYEGLNGSGVVASITYGKSRVIFDFGAPFNPMTQPYDGQVEKRKRAWIRDAIRLGQIPAVDGVFASRDLGSDSDILPYEDSDLNTGVIISHLHLDHMSGIGMIHPDIPVYLHREGYKLQMLLNQIGESIGERDFSPIDLYQPFSIGDIEVTAYFSDHPCAGAVGFLINTPDANYFYSGDVRFHGGNLEKVLEDLQKVAAEDIDVLIMEGTTFSPSKFSNFEEDVLKPSLDIPDGMLSEQELLSQVYEDLNNTGALGVFNIYHRDMGLLEGLFNLAERANREIVFEPQTAFIVMHMLGKNPAVFIPDNKAYENRQKPYLKEVLHRTPRILSSSDILSTPDHFFIQNSYENILDLFDLAEKGAKYYHLYGIPLVEGSRSYRNMMRVLILTGTEYAAFANLYCYNHAYPNNLLYMADQINAKNLIPVHTSHPEKFKYAESWLFLPEKGQNYVLQNGTLTQETA